MNTIHRYPITYWFSILSMFIAGSVMAETPVDIEFEADVVTGKEWIRAKANCHASKRQVYAVFNAIIDYPDLHDWIQNTEEVSGDAKDQEFLIEFDLPWPVGKQWSRVRVQRDQSIISWRQIDGSLNKNTGSITIDEHDDQAHVDYRAILDLGYPDVLTRGYKEQFVTEFLRAIYERLNDDKQIAVNNN